MNILSADSIIKSYSGHTALDNVSFEIPAQSIFGLLGPNGAGKTTLIRIINQIIRADAGEIRLFDEILASRHIGMVGYLPEERGLYKKMKVGDQMLFLGQLKGLSRQESMKQIRYWFEYFEIKDWWSKKIEDLSKGMAQKIQFIGTILHQPKLIILDEPFSGFDPVNAQLITEVILDLRSKGATIVFSTHRMETVEALCDRALMINRSKKILEGSTQSIREQYRTGTFEVIHATGDLNLDASRFRLLDQKPAEGGLIRSDISILDGSKGNALLQSLITSTDIHSFREKLPSMAEIFISLVKGESDEVLKRDLGIQS
ncbi:MAG: ABC transporter ATP-binding protein [Cyclobacteriaceae bacterium]